MKHLNKKPTVIFDIDGTLADCSHRVRFVESKDWKNYVAEVVNDKVIEPTAFLLSAVGAYGASVVFCTTRLETCRAETEAWINGRLMDYLLTPIPYVLMMRKKGDRRDDVTVKKEMLDQLREDGHEVLFAVEDRKCVVDMWRANGVACMQCAEGDY